MTGDPTDTAGSVFVRGMLAEDIPALARLYKQFWGEDSDVGRMAQQLQRMQELGTHTLLCAVEGDRLLGSVMGIWCEELYGDCRPFMVLENMIVDGAARKRGIGGQLIAALEEEARARGCTQVLLVTEADRADACSFYASAGYAADTHRGFKKKL